MSEAFDLDLQYLESLVFILLNDKSMKCIESVSSFLRDPEFGISETAINQIVLLIQTQEKTVDPSYFFELIEDFVPPFLRKYKVFISKIFFPLVNSDFERSDISMLETITEVLIINELNLEKI